MTRCNAQFIQSLVPRPDAGLQSECVMSLVSIRRGVTFSQDELYRSRVLRLGELQPQWMSKGGLQKLKADCPRQL